MSVQDNGEFQFTKRESSSVGMDRNKVKPDELYSYKTYEELERKTFVEHFLAVLKLELFQLLIVEKKGAMSVKLALMHRLTGCLGPTNRV